MSGGGEEREGARPSALGKGGEEQVRGEEAPEKEGDRWALSWNWSLAAVSSPEPALEQQGPRVGLASALRAQGDP